LLTAVQQGRNIAVYENARRRPVKVLTLPGPVQAVTGRLTLQGLFDWDLAEIVIYDHALSDQEREALSATFVDQYDIR